MKLVYSAMDDADHFDSLERYALCTKQIHTYHFDFYLRADSTQNRRVFNSIKKEITSGEVSSFIAHSMLYMCLQVHVCNLSLKEQCIDFLSLSTNLMLMAML